MNLVKEFVINKDENTVSFRTDPEIPGKIIIENTGSAFLIESNFDYEFYVPATNTNRRLSAITDIQEEMKYCKPSLQVKTCNNSRIKSCMMDGITFDGYIPAISR